MLTWPQKCPDLTVHALKWACLGSRKPPLEKLKLYSDKYFVKLDKNWMRGEFPLTCSEIITKQENQYYEWFWLYTSIHFSFNEALREQEFSPVKGDSNCDSCKGLFIPISAFPCIMMIMRILKSTPVILNWNGNTQCRQWEILQTPNPSLWHCARPMWHTHVLQEKEH